MRVRVMVTERCGRQQSEHVLIHRRQL